MSSFAMSRITNLTKLPHKSFSLSQREIKALEENVTKYSPAYLIESPSFIKLRLTKKGVQIYNSRIFGRPEKISELSFEDTYVFDCTQRQAYNFFYSFGAEVEIISPQSLRDLFIKTHNDAIKNYL